MVLLRILGAEYRRYLAECRAYWPSFVTDGITLVLIFGIFFAISPGSRTPSAWFGYLLWILAQAVLTEGPIATNSEKQWGTLSQLLIKPVGFGLLTAVKTLVWLTVQAVFAAAVIGVLALVLRLPLAADWQLVPLGLVGLASLFGFTLVLTSLTILYSKTSGLVGIVSYALLFLTGALIPLTSLPWVLRGLAYGLPLTGAITAGRSVLDGVGLSGWSYAVIVVEALGYLVLGAVVFRLVMRRAMRRGIAVGY